MDENFLGIREQANVTRKTVSKLLNISVCMYMRYENHKWVIPVEIVMMFCKMFNISSNELYLDSSQFSFNTINGLEYISTLSEREQELYFMHNLTGEPAKRISYTRIEAVKKQLRKCYESKEVQ